MSRPNASSALSKHYGFARIGIIVPIALALAATVGALYVRSIAEKHKEAQILLTRVQSNVARQEIKVGRAVNLALVQNDEIALRPTLNSLSRHVSVLQTEVTETLEGVDVGGTGRVEAALVEFTERLETERMMLEDGDYDDAWRFHHLRVEPAFELLSSAIADADQVFAEAARRERLIGDGGTFLVVAFALAALVALQRRSERDRAAFARTLAHQALRDPLTELANRRLLNDRLEQALERSKRYGTKPGLVFIDLDGFKPVNDQLGHDAGDRVLREIAKRLETCTRGTDTVARMGGDEFAVLLDDARISPYVNTLIERLLAEIQAPFVIGGDTVELSASIGVAVAAEAETPDRLITRADTAMYSAKRSGKGGFRIAEAPSSGSGREPIAVRTPQLDGA